MKKIHQNKITYFTFLLLLILISIYYVMNQRLNKSFFFSYDPHYHYAITNLVIEKQEAIKNIDISINNSKIIYFSLLHILTAIIYLVTNIDLFYIYKFFSLFLFLLLIGLNFFILKEITKDDIISLLMIIIFSSNHFLLTRFSMLLPEHFILLISVFIIYLLFKNLFGYMLGLFCIVGYFFYHYISFIIFFIFLFLYFLFNIKNIKIDIKKLLLYIILFLILITPLISDIINSYSFIIKGFLNPSKKWSNIIGVQYNKIKFNELHLFLNEFIYLFLIISIIFIIKNYKNLKQYYPFIILSILIFLSFTLKNFKIDIPSERLLPYFCIFSLYIFGLSVKEFIYKKYFFYFFVFTAIILFNFNLKKEHGWDGIQNWEKHIIYYINKFYPDDIKIIYGAPYYVYLKNAEWDVLNPTIIYRSKDVNEMKKKLYELYKKNNILLVVTKSGVNKLLSSNPDFYKFMSNNEIFNYREVRIYRILKEELYEYTFN